MAYNPYNQQEHGQNFPGRYYQQNKIFQQRFGGIKPPNTGGIFMNPSQPCSGQGNPSVGMNYAMGPSFSSRQNIHMMGMQGTPDPRMISNSMTRFQNHENSPGRRMQHMPATFNSRMMSNPMMGVQGFGGNIGLEMQGTPDSRMMGNSMTRFQNQENSPGRRMQHMPATFDSRKMSNPMMGVQGFGGTPDSRMMGNSMTRFQNFENFPSRRMQHMPATFDSRMMSNPMMGVQGFGGNIGLEMQDTPYSRMMGNSMTRFQNLENSPSRRTHHMPATFDSRMMSNQKIGFQEIGDFPSNFNSRMMGNRITEIQDFGDGPDFRMQDNQNMVNQDLGYPGLEFRGTSYSKIMGNQMTKMKDPEVSTSFGMENYPTVGRKDLEALFGLGMMYSPTEWMRSIGIPPIFAIQFYPMMPMQGLGEFPGFGNSDYRMIGMNPVGYNPGFGGYPDMNGIDYDSDYSDREFSMSPQEEHRELDKNLRFMYYWCKRNRKKKLCKCKCFKNIQNTWRRRTCNDCDCNKIEDRGFFGRRKKRWGRRRSN